MIVSLALMLLIVFGGAILILLPGIPPSLINKEAAQWVATAALFLGSYWAGVRIGRMNRILNGRKGD